MKYLLLLFLVALGYCVVLIIDLRSAMILEQKSVALQYEDDPLKDDYQFIPGLY